MRRGKPVRDFPRLRHGGAHLTDPDKQYAGDVARRTLGGAVLGLLVAFTVALTLSAVLTERAGSTLRDTWTKIAAGHTLVPWRAMLLTVVRAQPAGWHCCRLVVRLSRAGH
jgi:peptide/nickel transport system permease protein